MGTPKNKSVMKAFSLLQSFHGPDEWLTSSELSRRARLPEASGYRLMQTLEDLGAVVRDSRGRYRPGMLILTLSQGVVAQDLWSRVPQTLLNDLARELDVAVQVGTVADCMVSYVARAGRPRAGFTFDVGSQFEAYCTAVGKVLLSSLDDRALDDVLSQGELVSLTSNTITDREALRRQLVQVRAECTASDDREMIDALACVAVPIHDAGGCVVAAISASDDAARIDEARQHTLRKALWQTAAAISKRLFPRGEPLRFVPGTPGGAPTLAACARSW